MSAVDCRRALAAGINPRRVTLALDARALSGPDRIDTRPAAPVHREQGGRVQLVPAAAPAGSTIGQRG